MKKHSGLKRAFLAVMGDEKRQNITIPLLEVLLGLVAGTIIFLILGKNPIEAFVSLLRGCGLFPKENYAGGKGMFTDFRSYLDNWTPMLFAALAVAVAFKAGLFNIGVSGQMLMAGFIATITVGYSGLPAAAAKPLVIVIGIVVGALVGGLIGWLKYRFNINEVVSAIMINYIFQYLLSFFIQSFYVNPITRQSNVVSEASRLTLQNVQIGPYKTVIPLGFVLALVAVGVLHYFIHFTKFGYELKAVGFNTKASKYAGINVRGTIMKAMMVSGALAGLAGVTYYLGYLGSIQPRVLTDVGFDSIAVSLLGNANPIGIVFASFLITVITKGSTYMSSAVGVAQEIGSVITGLMLLFAACGAFVRYKLHMARMAAEEEDKLAAAGKDGKGGDGA